jgi:hypothetical protein
MVKMKSKVIQKKDTPKKRGSPKPTKRNTKEKRKKKKENSREASIESTTDSISNLKYHHDDRHFIFVGILDLFEKINENGQLPDNLIFSTIAIFDSYLEKTEKRLNKADMVKVVYASLDILDKEQNVNIFNAPIFKQYYDEEIEYEILETVDLELYPEKPFDHFQKFYYELMTHLSHSDILLEFLEKFKKTFFTFAFFLAFNENSLKKSPISNFISCLIATYEKCYNFMPKEAKIIENYINSFKSLNNYSDDEFLCFKGFIMESYSIFNSISERLSV